MAGVKVTDLTTLGAADANDIMYIVDTTANQSKQIQVQDIYSGMPQFDSGFITLTASNETNGATASASVYPAIYNRVNDVVTFTIPLNVQLGVSNDDTNFSLSIPIASNFNLVKQAFGLSSPAENLLAVEIYSDDGSFGAAGSINVYVKAASNGLSFAYLTITVQYLVIP